MEPEPPPAVARTRPATAFAGSEGGTMPGSTGLLGGAGAESDGEIVDFGGGGIWRLAPNRSRKTAVHYMRSPQTARGI